MRTRNSLINFGPCRNETEDRLRVSIIESTRTTDGKHITLCRAFLVVDKRSLGISVERLDTQRLKTYIILRRNVKIIETKTTKRRVKTTIIYRVRHKSSHNEERTILAERKTTFFETVTSGHLTSKRTKRRIRRIEASSLIDDIRTKKTTVGTEENRTGNILNTTDIELRLNIVRVTRTTSHSKLEIPLNMRSTTNIRERNRRIIARRNINLHNTIRTVDERSLKPLLKIVGRKRTLKKRTRRTQPLPRKKYIIIATTFLSNPIGYSLSRILRALQAQKNISQILKKANDLFTGKTKPSSRNIDISSSNVTSRRDYIILLIDVEIVDDIEIRNNFRYIEITIVILITLKRNSCRNSFSILFGEKPTNRKTKIIGKRIRLNHNLRKSIKSGTKSLLNFSRNKKLIMP